jgi:hypothetical protein
MKTCPPLTPNQLRLDIRKLRKERERVWMRERDRERERERERE